MNTRTKHFLKLLGIVGLIALAFTVLPSVIYGTLMTFLNLVIWIAFIYFLYRMFGGKIKPNLDRYIKKRRYEKRKNKSWYSDKR